MKVLSSFLVFMSMVLAQGNGDYFSHILNHPTYKAGDSVSVRYLAHEGREYDGQVRTEIAHWENEAWKVTETRTLRVSISDRSIGGGFSFDIEYGSSLWAPGDYRVSSQTVDTGYGGWSQNFRFKEVSFFTISGAQFAGLVQTRSEEASRASRALLANPNLGCDNKLTFPAVLGAGTDSAPAFFYQDLGENQVIHRAKLTSKPAKNAIGLETSVVLPNNFHTETPVMVHIVDRGNPTQWVGRDFIVYDASQLAGDTCYAGTFSK